MKRKRIFWFIAFIIIIPVGLSTRKYGYLMPGFIATYGGDVLYATMFYIIYAFIFPTASVLRISIYALLSCYCIEVLQLYKAPWIQAIRHTRIGGLILGFDFFWSDLVCYTVGVLLGAFVETIILYFRRNAYFRK